MSIQSRILALAAALITIATINGNCSAQLFPTYINGQFTLGSSGGSSPYDLDDTFFLESNPTASKTIYLDFDGFHSINNRWSHSSGDGIMFDPFDRNGDVNSFSNSELIEIQRQFQNVAEDFLPFDVNVTTMFPGIEKLRRTDENDNEYGIRSVNTQAKDGFGNGIGGVAYLNSFDDNADNPVFTFNKGANNGSITNSHEVGHALGLGHDGLNSSTYHPGTGDNSSPVSWGPIMGAPFGKNLTQWSNGDYAGSTNTQDDYSIITKTANGFDFRVDQIGDTISTAKALSLQNGEGFDWGIIEENVDVDMFEIDLAKGILDLEILTFQDRPNLDILARFYDQNGLLIAESNPLDDVEASFQLDIEQAGLYYVSVEGTGLPGVYSDYGSIGFFTINASFTSAIPEPTGCLAIALLGLIGFRFRRGRS